MKNVGECAGYGNSSLNMTKEKSVVITDSSRITVMIFDKVDPMITSYVVGVAL